MIWLNLLHFPVKSTFLLNKEVTLHYVTKELISRNIFKVIAFHNVKFSLILFWHKLCETNILLKKLLKSWFHEIFFRLDRISRFSTLYRVEKLEILPHWKIFREINSLVMSRNYCQKGVRVNFQKFFTCVFESWKNVTLSLHPTKFLKAKVNFAF